MVFSLYIEVYIHHYSPYEKTLSPKGSSVLSAIIPRVPIPPPQASMNPPTAYLWICLFQAVRTERTTQYMVLRGWLPSCRRTSSATLTTLEQALGSHSHQRGLHRVDMPRRVHPLISWDTAGSLLLWLITNCITLKIHIQVFMWTYVFFSLGYTPRSRIVGSYNNSS